MNAVAAPLQPVGEADARSKLDAIVRSQACEEGRAIVLDFGAIRTRLSDRWMSRREGVWAHVERAVLRGAGRDALYHRLDEIRYLLAFPEQSGAAALSVGLNVMEGVLVHFLGVVSQEDRVIHMVASIEGEAVSLTPQRPSERRAFTAGNPPWAKVARPFAAAAGPALVRDDTPLRVRIGIEEVFDLRAQAILGSRIAASVYDEGVQRVLTHQEIFGLPTHRLLAVKTGVLEAANGLLGRPMPPVVIVPLLLQAFASSSVRFSIMERIYTQARENRARLIFELVGIDGGTPVSRVQEVLSLLRPACRSVICRSRPTHSGLEVIREAGARGIAIGAQEIGCGGERLSAGLMAFGAAVKTVASLRMATGLDDRSQLAICTLAGYTHASVAAPATDD